MPEYTLGPANSQRADTARFETKPPAWTGSRWDTGAGYERWRSYEYRPGTPRRGKEDVYVSVHRLCAVAWKLPPDAPLSALGGVDVHHESGVEWDNREDNFTLLDHGRHSEVTQAEMRAYAEDAKKQSREPTPDSNRCDECGDEDPSWTVEGRGGSLCLDCAVAVSDGRTITEA